MHVPADGLETDGEPDRLLHVDFSSRSNVVSQHAGPHHLRRIGALVDAEAEQCREEGRHDVDGPGLRLVQPPTSGVDGFSKTGKVRTIGLWPVMRI